MVLNRTPHLADRPSQIQRSLHRGIPQLVKPDMPVDTQLYPTKDVAVIGDPSDLCRLLAGLERCVWHIHRHCGGQRYQPTTRHFSSNLGVHLLLVLWRDPVPKLSRLRQAVIHEVCPIGRQIHKKAVVRLPPEPHLHTPCFEFSGGAVLWKLEGMGKLASWDGCRCGAWVGQPAVSWPTCCGVRSCRWGWGSG